MIVAVHEDQVVLMMHRNSLRLIDAVYDINLEAQALQHIDGHFPVGRIAIDQQDIAARRRLLIAPWTCRIVTADQLQQTVVQLALAYRLLQVSGYTRIPGNS